LLAQGELLWNVVRDTDPANDASGLWLFGGEVDLPLRGLYATGFVGLTQRFSAEPREPAFEPSDSLVALGYRHSLQVFGSASAAQPGVATSSRAQVLHRVRVILPTSRDSRERDLNAVIDWLTVFRVPLLEGNQVGFTLRNRYRFHEFAERAGLEGGLNDRLILRGTLAFQQRVVKSASLGQWLILGELGTRYTLRYPSRDTFEVPSSDTSPWFQDWIWEAGLAYVPSMILNARLTIGQDTQLQRQGIVTTAFAQRDEFNARALMTASF
jgi:hypothetical protein